MVDKVTKNSSKWSKTNQYCPISVQYGRELMSIDFCGAIAYGVSLLACQLLLLHVASVAEGMFRKL